MTLRTIMAAALMLASFVGKAQWETGIFAGGSNYLGDLAPRLVADETNLAAGAFARFNVNESYALNFQISRGHITGDDANFEAQQIRNLSFFSDITEFSAQFEFNFMPFANGPRTYKFSPYAAIGFSVFWFEPYTEFNGREIALPAIHTEGQNIEDFDADNPNAKAYDTYNFAVPLTFGFKAELSNRWRVGLFATFSGTFTDYLDDVSSVYVNQETLGDRNGGIAETLSDRSGEIGGTDYGKPGMQRGNSLTTDWFAFAGLSVSYKLSESRCYDFSRIRLNF